MQRWMRVVAAVGMRQMAVGLVSASAAMLAAAAPAMAQPAVKAVQPYVVVVTTDKAPMQGGDGDLYYPVRELKAGELLRVNAEGTVWLRVDYTPGMKAYVHASDAEAAKDGKSIRLIRQSQLLSFDSRPNAGGRAPWWPLDMEAPLAAGTTLEVLSEDKGPDGVVKGYVVPAPAKARGFVKKDHVRRATPEEASKFAGAEPPSATPAAAAPGTSTPAPAGEAPAGAPGVPPGFAPVTPAAAQPESATPPGATPPEATPAVPVIPVREPPPPPKKDEDVEKLRTAFDKAMSTSDGGDVDALIQSFERKINSLGSTPVEQSLKMGLEQRLAVLKFRQEVMQEAARVEAATAERQSRITEVRLIVERAEKQAIYNIVGRVVPSTVYDGKRGLPLLYRVESADALAPRTVGYILPNPQMDLTLRLGKVCGIVGDTRFDDSLGLNIISPKRVDVLGVNAPAPGTVPAPAAAEPNEGPVSSPWVPATPELEK